ncbi:myocyte-specific enhancer factor 2A [Triplophysa rosa]|uniref:Myocyte-specific enhancer factor 2A-like n=1 Tax=Triplophysa rosa TaxID=992332 RepID=A0A9W7X4V6_TRIRA|nr:myocyte-specific enhancer factor 2A [Triplophysa rosa]XP_057186987.1 myocyte-specific enhancer factor 2A [Triplophysa rosa]XP_057186991.1 myocyte-specific enhancer factor 2A [Triplophysa rosa]KAI7814147.1 putative myocyte-specific enhancer factor 2A-like [Triplophysa rosa]
MGRKKIQITRIMDERNRQVTFTKRKFGLMKKAYELSVLCDCEIALIIFNSSNKLFQYASTDMDKVLLKYTEYNEPHESRTNSDIVEVLNKKEQRGCDSPDPDASYVLTSHTEEKYQKINEEFDNMMRNHKIPAVLGQQSFCMPVSNPASLSYSTDSSLDTPVSLSGTGVLSLSSSGLQNTDSAPVLDGVPTSSVATPPNGVYSPPAANGFIGGSEGRAVQQKSAGRRPELKVRIPPARSGSPGRVNSPQSSQSLSTPVVSVATPSLHPQGLVYSAMTSSYDTDFALNSAEPSTLHGFGSPECITSGPGLSWEHCQPGQPGFSTQRTTHPQPFDSNSISIKSEPTSPPRERAHSLYPNIHIVPLPDSRQEFGRSPADSFSSSGSSYEGSDREDQRVDSLPVTATQRHGSRSSPGAEDQDDPSFKRMRTDSWVT